MDWMDGEKWVDEWMDVRQGRTESESARSVLLAC